MAEYFNVSRTAIWKNIKALQEEGYIIATHKNSGYTLSDDNDVLTIEGIESCLTAKVFAKRIELLSSITSTNSYLKGLDLPSLPEGYTVIADCQTEGRGRMGRKFHSPNREGLYISFLLKPSISTAEIQLVTVCAAVAVCRAINLLLGIQTSIKWVNDIFYNDKKLCGILTEATFSAELNRIESVVVGIGINTGKVAKDVLGIATSLYQISGKKGLREPLAAALINEFEKIYFALGEESKRKQIIDEYRDRLFIIGKKVMINNFRSVYPAIVRGIDANASLLVTTSEGEEQTLRSGEISLIL